MENLVTLPLTETKTALDRGPNGIREIGGVHPAAIVAMHAKPYAFVQCLVHLYGPLRSNTVLVRANHAHTQFVQRPRAARRPRRSGPRPR